MKHKMMILLSIGVMLIMTAIPTFAQDDVRTIQVTGVGIAFGTPDMATVEVGVDIRDADFGTAFDTANATMTTVLAQVSDLGIAPEDIQTTSINVWFEDEYNPQNGMPTGERIYHVTQSMRIVVRDIDMISSAITTAVDSGANQIFGLNFSFSDTESLETSARETAVGNARAKAEHLAELMGVELGDVVSVVDFGANGFPRPMGGGMAFDMVESMNVSPGQLSVTANIQVTFAIR